MRLVIQTEGAMHITQDRQQFRLHPGLGAEALHLRHTALEQIPGSQILASGLPGIGGLEEAHQERRDLRGLGGFVRGTIAILLGLAPCTLRQLLSDQCADRFRFGTRVLRASAVALLLRQRLRPFGSFSLRLRPVALGLRPVALLVCT
jgi:hypothetical protein